jgi:hypothetical protein
MSARKLTLESSRMAAANAPRGETGVNHKRQVDISRGHSDNSEEASVILDFTKSCTRSEALRQTPSSTIPHS